MLKKISIKDYKSLSDCTLHLKALNLLSGPNSSGKSSVIQSLLLASDNLLEKAGTRGLQAKKTETSQFNEVRNFITNAKSYKISVSADDNAEVTLNFIPADEAYLATNVEQLEDASPLLYRALDNMNIMYLPATRTGVSSAYPMNPDPSNKLGHKGEFVIDYYAKHRQDKLDSSLIFIPGSNTLEGQVNARLEKLTGYKLIVETIGSNHYVKYENRRGKQILPYHVGTGVSFMAEVLIVCFATPKGGLVITENPEIHLHPEAQAELIDFMAQIAKTGTQIIIESHSDHLFNGIRRLIRKGGLELSDTAVYNFRQTEDALSYAEQVEFTPQGGISSYISGMFEQFDKDLDAILGL